MTADEILSECNKVFIEQLDNPSIVLKRETVAADVEEWDSLNHMQLIVAIEKHFKIRFSSSEIQNFSSVGDLVDGISKKRDGK